jgi:hypothetical protein
METEDNNNNDINNSIQFISIQYFIIYVPSQQPQGQLQTQHNVDKSNYIMDNLTAQRPIAKLA